LDGKERYIICEDFIIIFKINIHDWIS